MKKKSNYLLGLMAVGATYFSGVYVTGEYNPLQIPNALIEIQEAIDKSYGRIDQELGEGALNDYFREYARSIKNRNQTPKHNIILMDAFLSAAAEDRICKKSRDCTPDKLRNLERRIVEFVRNDEGKVK